MLNLDSFKYHLPIQLRWNDLDALNHVNNAVYATYLEMARGWYLQTAFDWDWMEHTMILAHLSIDYRMPILITDHPLVYLRCTKLGNKSFDMEYMIVVLRNGVAHAAATAHSVQVMFDYATQKTVTIPHNLRQLMAQRESIAAE